MPGLPAGKPDLSYRFKHLLRQTEFQVLLVFFFLFLFLIPVLRGDDPAQAPAAFGYLFLIWGLCIAVMLAITRAYPAEPRK
jgi:ABC-type transport system involved in cytochrome c biogenesis permease component